MEMAMTNDVLRIGVTGHIRLTRGSVRPIYRELRALLAELSRRGPVHGITCLADGADSLFARAVRDSRASFQVILPGPPSRRRALRRLLEAASAVEHVDPGPRPELRYATASERVLQECDVLVAVWDGRQEGTHGGTAYTVARARQLGKEVRVVWPRRAKRRGYVGGGSMSHSSRTPAMAARTSG
jgi:hypothetical protein